MNLEKLNPWNWFKHEDGDQDSLQQVPISRIDDANANAVRTHSNLDSLLQLHREMDRLFDNVFNTSGLASQRSLFPERRFLNNDVVGTCSRTPYRPQIDISGDENHYEITLNVPGLSSDDVAIDVQGDRLMIRGHKEENSETKNQHYYRTERSVGGFQRTLSLPEDANSDEITASLKDGVLLLSIPRHQIEARDVKRISISS